MKAIDRHKGFAATVREFVKSPIRFFTGLLSRTDGGRNRAVRFILLLLYTIRGLKAHKTGVRCAALTFYTLISIVPILAIVFAIVKGFGLMGEVLGTIDQVFAHQHEIINYITDFAEKALANTNSGIVAAVGVVVLFWSVIRVFNSVESAFNHIWEVKSSRRIVSKYPVYITIVVFLPLLWAGISSCSSFLLDRIELSPAALGILSRVTSLLSIWMVFTVLYYAIPNTRVKLDKAFVAAVIAGTLFMLFQWGYVYIQRITTSYNAIYGSFAALPLFLLWVRYSWTIILFGGEFSFAYQNMEKFTEESTCMSFDPESRRKIAIAAMTFIVWRFAKGGGAVKISEIRSQLNLPARIVNTVLGMLAESGQVIELPPKENREDTCYIPAQDSSNFTIQSIAEALDRTGSAHLNELELNELVAYAGSEYEKLKQSSRRSECNRRIVDMAMDNEQMLTQDNES